MPDIDPHGFATYRKEPPEPATASTGGGNWRTVLFRYLQEPRSPLLQVDVFERQSRELAVVVIGDG